MYIGGWIDGLKTYIRDTTRILYVQAENSFTLAQKSTRPCCPLRVCFVLDSIDAEGLDNKAEKLPGSVLSLSRPLFTVLSCVFRS